MSTQPRKSLDGAAALEVEEGSQSLRLSTISLHRNHTFGLPLDLRIELLEYRAGMVEATLRKRSSRMVLLGAVSGFLGFQFVALIGAIKANTRIAFLHHDDYCQNYKGEALLPCYFPSTVSEMVSDTGNPAGKVFFCFEFVSALLIFFSFYPMQLRNCYIGDDFAIPYTGVAWVSFRQYVPAPGMMLLAGVPTVPMARANILDYFCIYLHLSGATMMFVGYVVAESITVGWGPVQGVVPEKRHFTEKEGRIRRRLLHCIVIFYIIFCLLQVLLVVGPSWLEHSFDEWELPDREHYKHITRPVLVRAAGYPVKWMKLLSYGSEVLCGLFLIASHLFIWYTCEERNYDLPEELLRLSKEQVYLSTELREALLQNQG